MVKASEAKLKYRDEEANHRTLDAELRMQREAEARVRYVELKTRAINIMKEARLKYEKCIGEAKNVIKESRFIYSKLIEEADIAKKGTGLKFSAGMPHFRYAELKKEALHVIEEATLSCNQLLEEAETTIGESRLRYDKLMNEAEIVKKTNRIGEEIDKLI